MRPAAKALGYNVALGIIGGVTPLVATWLVYRTHNESPALLVMAAAAISFLTVLGFKETSRVPLQTA